MNLRPDFRIYTASLIPDGNAVDGTPSTVVRMTGSSTEQDVQKNRMSVDALRDMQNPLVLGMNIFLNHRYDLPHDLYGRLAEVPSISAANGFLDLGLVVDTDMRNPPAAQTLQQIRDGHKHGCSIGCMVDAWEPAGENDNPLDDPIILTHVTPVEWSVVGIPANRRCWVENAISGKFVRTLEEEDYDQAYQLASTVKSLFSYDYEKLVLRLPQVERSRFERIPARRTPGLQLFWQPDRSTFVMRAPNAREKALTRSEVMTVLHDIWGDTSDTGETKEELMTKKVTDTRPDAVTGLTTEVPSSDVALAIDAPNDGGSESASTTPSAPPQAMGTASNMPPAPASSGSTGAPAAGSLAGGASNSIPPPNDATSNPSPANNAGAYSLPIAPALPPNALKNLDPQTGVLLTHYNSIGATLGLAPVDGRGTRSEESLAVFRLLAEEIMTFSQRIALTLDLPMPQLVQGIISAFGSRQAEVVVPPVAETPASTPPAEAPQNTPPSSTVVTATTVPSTTTLPNTTTSTLPNTALSLEAQMRFDAMQQNLAASELRAQQLAMQIEQIQGRGLGRPTHAFPDRMVPYGFEPDTSIEAQTPDELRAKTTIVRRKDGVLCRHWATGVGQYQRPLLSADQMSLMSPLDMNAYRDGREILVPMIDEGD